MSLHVSPAPDAVPALLDRIAELRKQQAELQAQEQKATAELRQQLEMLRQRLDAMGLASHLPSAWRVGPMEEAEKDRRPISETRRQQGHTDRPTPS